MFTHWMTRLILIAVFALAGCVISTIVLSEATQADTVPLETAREATINFLGDTANADMFADQINTAQASDDLETALISNVTTEFENGTPIYYIINLNPEGWVIMAADDVSRPIIGYSSEGTCSPEDVPPAFEAWISEIEQDIHNAILQNLEPLPAATAECTALTLPTTILTDPNAAKVASSVSPLLPTKWSQGGKSSFLWAWAETYDYYCPREKNWAGHYRVSPTGCVATAMGQVMRYYQWPPVGSGSKTWDPPYSPSDGSGQWYDWASMPSQVTSLFWDIDNNEKKVAAVLRHIGVSVEMNYEPGGSGASPSKISGALRSYFRYACSDLTYRSNYTNTAWINLLKGDLNAGHPILYGGSSTTSGGHRFVCDGYDTSNRFHFNWGWGGSHDGYYTIGDLTPGSYDFRTGQSIVYSIRPNYPSQVWVDDNYSSGGSNDGHLWGFDAFNSIQNAINSSIRSGGTIHVAPGLYRGSIKWNGKDLSLIGAGPGTSTASASILDGLIDLPAPFPDIQDTVIYTQNLSSASRLEGFTIRNGKGIYGGGMKNTASWLKIIDCVFTGNRADINGGGIYNQNGSPTIANCVFSANNSLDSGGAIYNNGASPTMTTCTISGNTARWGGGMYNSSGAKPHVIHCVFYGNTASVSGGGVRNYTNASPKITNSILWGNTSPSGSQIHNYTGATPTVTYCDVQGGYSGTGNINADPRFLDATGSNFHLAPGCSPCINAGSNAAASGTTHDFDGDARIIAGTVDMGIDEAQPTSTLAPPGKALAFNGGTEYISVSMDEPETEVTHELWFKTTNANAGILSITNGPAGSASHDRHLYLSGGNLKARLWNNEVISTTGLNLADGNWHHVAHVFGSSIGGQKLYIDGVQRASGSKTTSDFNWQNRLLIGYSADAGSKYFAGEIDDVRVWTAARSLAQIRQDMHRPLTGNEADLFALFNCDQVITGTIGDQTCNHIGLVANMDSSNLKTSYVPLGNDTVLSQSNISAVWSGNPTTDTTTGLSMESAISDPVQYAVFGDNTATGSTTGECPSGIDARLGRIWYIDQHNSPPADLIFDLGNAQSGESVLTAAQYSLLYRTGDTGDFTCVTAGASSINSNAITFSAGISGDGYYTLGITDATHPAGPHNALLLREGNDSIEAGTLTLGDSHTIEFWIKFNGTSSSYTQVMAKHASASNRSPGIWNVPNKAALHWRYNPNNKGTTAVGPDGEGSQFVLNQWYHVAGVKDSNKLTLYVNGDSVSTDTLSIPITTGAGIFYIGKTPGYNAFNGALDEIRVWNTARSVSEIRRDMHRTLTGSESGLAAYYNCDHLPGDILRDVTGSHPAMTPDIDYSNLAPSYAPIGNRTAMAQSGLTAVWSTNPATTTTSGLSMTSSITPEDQYGVFGHNGQTATTSKNCPAGTDVRLGRIWYVDPSNAPAAAVTFDLSDAQAGIGSLPWSQYTLLRRSGTSGSFTVEKPMPDDVDGDNITFTDIVLKPGYWTLGIANAETILYVDTDAAGTGSGDSWTHAMTDLQNALSVASANPGIRKIWVAEGTYTPGTDRNDAFAMLNGVSIYGGFAGSETDLNQRDWKIHPTILSGDIGTFGDTSDNCYHVFYHPDTQGLDNSAVLDGFTINGGNAESGNGGGMLNSLSSPTLVNCTFSNNMADNGGGMANISASPTLTNCVFFGNAASNGGGMFNEASASPELINCTLSGNTAISNGSDIANYLSSPTINNCILWSDGSPIYNEDASIPQVAYSNIRSSGGSLIWNAPLGSDLGGNIDADPLFFDPLAGDLRLTAGSPCIDAADNTAVPAEITRDFEGDSRFIEAPTTNTGNGMPPIADIGADEFDPGSGPTQPVPDMPALILLALGLLAMAGFCWLRRQQYASRIPV